MAVSLTCRGLALALLALQCSLPAAADGHGHVYVADHGNHRIVMFDDTGTFITQWGVQGSGNREFEYPHGVAVGSALQLYVLDTYNNRVQQFGPDGVPVRSSSWGSLKHLYRGDATTGNRSPR